MFNAVIQPQYVVPQLLLISCIISFHELVNELAFVNTPSLQLQRSPSNTDRGVSKQ